MTEEISDEGLDTIEREMRYARDRGLSVWVGSRSLRPETSVALMDAFRVARERLAPAEAVIAAVREAWEHDRGCEEEGEGECCLRAWRRVMLIAGAARPVTQEDHELLGAPVVHPEPITGGEGR